MEDLIALAVAFGGLGCTAFTLGYAPGWLTRLFEEFAKTES